MCHELSAAMMLGELAPGDGESVTIVPVVAAVPREIGMPGYTRAHSCGLRAVCDDAPIDEACSPEGAVWCHTRNACALSGRTACIQHPGQGGYLARRRVLHSIPGIGRAKCLPVVVVPEPAEDGSA